MIFQICIIPLHVAPVREQSMDQGRARFPAFFILCNRLKRNIAAMFPAHAGISEHSGRQQIFQKRAAVRFYICTALRTARFLRIESQLFLPDVKQRRREYVRMDSPAALQNMLPVNIRAVRLGIVHNVADLTDAEPAVQEMLECMKDQVEQMIGM